MKVVAPIKNLKTGEVRTYCHEFDAKHGDASVVEYMWDDGNYACDCNRHEFFARAAGLEPDDDDECGNVRYGVEWIEVDGMRRTLPEEALRREWDAEQAKKAAP